MNLSAVLTTMISEVVAEQKLSTPANPMSDELQRFIGALMKKAKDRPHPIP